MTMAKAKGGIITKVAIGFKGKGRGGKGGGGGASRGGGG